MQKYQPTEENLAKCKELLLNPKYHSLRMRTIETNVASKRKSRYIFRASQTAVLNCIFDYAEDHYPEYRAFMDEVKKEFAAANADAKKEDPTGVKIRGRVTAAVQRARYRKQLVRAYVFLKSGKPKPPTWAEVKDEIKRLQNEWAEEAEAEMIADPTEGLSTVRKRKIYDQITERLEAEVKRLKKEKDEQRKRDLECDDAGVVRDVPAEVLPDSSAEGH